MMAGLTLAWEYLTGYSVATDPGNRDRAEWPPHPGRVFLALAAAWFETAPGEDATDEERLAHEAEGNSLRWLESLGAPQLHLPVPGGERTNVTFFVPVNDKAGPSSATLQSAPAMTRTRQARTFPRVHVGDTICRMLWPEANQPEQYVEALDLVCAKVTRIGHSSSLARMWVADDFNQEHTTELDRWIPADAAASAHCRAISAGMLDSLPQQTQIPRIEAYAQCVWRIDDAKRAVQRAKADGDANDKRAAALELKQAESDYLDAFGAPYRGRVMPPPRLRPKLGLWSSYQRSDPMQADPGKAHSHFDTDLLVLARISGSQLPVTSTLSVMQALRGAVMQFSGIQPVPSWVSGHREDGTPSDEESGHLALIPLPFVGHQNADGHMVGVGFAFPRGVGHRERGQVLGPLVVEESGEPRDVELTLGRLGVWKLRKCGWWETRRALNPESWTANIDGASRWATVTPVVLDKFPKGNRREPRERDAWEREVRGMIARACLRIGLPAPVHIDIDTTSWHVGAPRATGKRRPRRGRTRSAESETALLGDGFPPFPPKGANASRPQVHAFLEFAEPVVGPILLGAGRYRGYGLCKPWENRQSP